MIKIIFIVIIALEAVTVFTSVALSSAAPTVFCTCDTRWDVARSFCIFNKIIETEVVDFAPPESPALVETFYANRGQKIKFLPRNIGRRLPNLTSFEVTACELTIVRDFYFENMQKLVDLDLQRNRITTIEAKAFDDLAKLRELNLLYNLVETLDAKLFVKMINLQYVWLHGNKIKFLSPTTFNIPGNGKLQTVGLWENVCISEIYSFDFDQLESDLRAFCKLPFFSYLRQLFLSFLE